MPPAYEVLLLNTAIPQIQAAQSGDTYLVPRDIAFSTVANLANGTNLLPSLTFSSDTNTGIYREGADALGFTAGGGTNQMVLTSTGLGIGTNNPGASTKLNVAGRGLFTGGAADPSDSTSSGVAINYDGTTGFVGAIQTGVAVKPLRVYGSSIVLALSPTATPSVTLDSSGNLGLGVTPSGWSSAFKALQVSNTIIANNGFNDSFFGANYFFDGTNNRYINNDFAAAYGQVDGTHRWYTAPSGTANSASVADTKSYTVVALGTTTLLQWQALFSGLGSLPSLGQVITATATGSIPNGGLVTQNISFTQAMTLDASGNLGIQYTSPSTMNSSNGSGVLVVGSGTGSNGMTIFSGSTNTSRITFADSATGAGSYDGQIAYDHSAQAIAFNNQNQEKARITSGGYFKASDNGTYTGISGTYHEFTQSANNGGLLVNATNASFSDIALIVYATRNTTNNSFYALSYYNTGAAVYKFRVADSGDVTNTNGTYGTISDAKMKTNIVDAGSQWSDIKALRFRKFKMKNDPSGLVQLGVVAQEVELTSPGLVDEHADRDQEGNDLGTTTKSVKTSVLLMKAAVALQEAMARIEKLEAEVAALKGA